jgi:Flp pilus assembly protein TadG
MVDTQPSKGEASVNPRLRKRRLPCVRRAQAAVEFALIAPILLLLLVVGVQLAIIGDAALGLGQVDYQGARYAAVNPSYSQSQIQSYMVSVASPLIGANNGSYLTATMSPAPPCAFGSTVTVAVSFDIAHLVVLPNPFLGVAYFPTVLTNSQSAFCEG